MKFISPRLHGIIDYAAVLVLLNAPTVFGFVGRPAKLAYWLAFIHLLLTGITSMPLGAFKLVPARVHGYLELVVGILVALSPRILGFGEIPAARNFFVAFGIALIGVYFLTQYAQPILPPERAPGDRRMWWGGPKD